MSEKYILAMYDVAGKQEYIFRQPTIKQIVGASCIIRDVFKDYLYPAAKTYCGKTESDPDVIYDYNKFKGNDNNFTVEGFKKHMKNGYVGEVVYEGGGNFIILYKDKETCININKIFTKKLMANTYSLKVLCTYIEVDLSVNKFEDDRKKLYDKHLITQNQQAIIRPINVFPFTQIEKETSLPLGTTSNEIVGNNKKVSVEGYAKYEKYREVVDREYGEKLLDNLVPCKGEDSLLAVIFIDGNNMGAKVQGCLKEKETYEECVKELRDFSYKIQKEYVDDRVKAITDKLYAGNEKDKAAELMRRMVVFAGDEMSFIVAAKDAMKAVEAYFEDMPKGNSSCAGIAIFHSHAPYSEAYKIAEECCESGKRLMKEIMKKKKDKDKYAPSFESCYVDFQYCQSGLGMDLETIRKREVDNTFISKPWLIKLNDNVSDVEKYKHLKEIEEISSDINKKLVLTGKKINESYEGNCLYVNRVIDDLNKLDSRTNIKKLAKAAKSSLTEFDMEMERIYAHQSKDVQKNIQYTFKILKGEERRKLIYDIVIVYDLWYIKREDKK